MCEEYLSAKELLQKIAELKIRLALQQEFEQEVDELAAEADLTDAGQLRRIREMEERVLDDIAAHTARRRPRRKRRFSQAARIAAVLALLVMVSVSSAMATVHMVQIGLLKLDIRSYPERTSYGLSRT